jgi:tRNA uridine 5-carboxymethylaminomethyl modification enzyme
MQVQPGDDPAPVFSYLGRAAMHPRQLPCWITHTTAETHEIILAGLDRSPMYTGVIEGVGPRYCPSIEDKIKRFADKDSHQIFPRAGGPDHPRVLPQRHFHQPALRYPDGAWCAPYPAWNGRTSCAPAMPSNTIIYDPRGLKRRPWRPRPSAACFFAGQINGTTGYEEAAAQGLLAGLNAGLSVQDKDGWWPRRDEAYLGVLVDDLITRGVSTSRIACSPAAPNTGSACARTTPICA